MGFLDRLFGGQDEPRQGPPQRPQGAPPDADEAAIQRYRYLLRTAPPEAIEDAHAEAFARLTPEQRRQVLDQLSSEVPPSERAPSDDPRQLARMATRAEMRYPGVLERSLGRGGGGMGMGMGGVFAGSLLGSVAGAFIGTSIASAMLGGFDGSGADVGADPGGDAGGDAGGGYGGDAGGEYSDGGGDLGGGDFGGGDFGGGDFGGDMGF